MKYRYLIVFIISIFFSCNKKKDIPNSTLLKVNLSKGQEMIYDVQYTYTLSKPLFVGNQSIYYRNIYQNLHIKVLEKNKETYTISTHISHLRWEDYNKDSILVALYDSKFKHLNIGYGENFTALIENIITHYDTLVINENSGYSTIDTFSYIPFFFHYPSYKLAGNDTFGIQIPSGKETLQIDSISSSALMMHTLTDTENTFKGSYIINSLNGNIIQGSQNFTLRNHPKYKIINISYNQIK